MQDQFQRWLITLGAQTLALYKSLPHANTEHLSKEMKACEAVLQHLYDYAKQYDFTLINYYQPFAEIEAHLLLTHKHLRDTTGL